MNYYLFLLKYLLNTKSICNQIYIISFKRNAFYEFKVMLYVITVLCNTFYEAIFFAINFNYFITCGHNLQNKYLQIYIRVKHIFKTNKLKSQKQNKQFICCFSSVEKKYFISMPTIYPTLSILNNSLRDS